MQTREKYLAGGLGAIVALWFLAPRFDAAFLQPVRDARETLESVQSEVSDKEDREIELMRATARLKTWRDQSLPPDPLVAQRVYAQWLTDIAQATGWSELGVKLDGKAIRGNAYVTIPVTIQGAATREQLANFLARFEEVALLQRISRLNIESPTANGEPRLKVNLTAEGLSVVGASDRSRLFPSAELAKTIDLTETRLTLKSVPPGFPKEAPFRVRIDGEWVDVTAGQETEWTVTRAIGGFPMPHAEGALVEYAPPRSDDDLARLAAAWPAWTDLRPFVKPRPPINYDPKFSPVTPDPVVLGKEWSLDLKVTGWDPADGEPRYQFVGQPPEGLTLNQASGALSWKPKEGTPTEKYAVEVAALPAKGGEPVTTTKLSLEVRLPNHPPKFRAGNQVSAYPGQPLDVVLAVEDPDLPRDELTFSLEGTPPTGMTIDSRTGRLQWMPPATEPLAQHSLAVVVRDKGPPSESDRLELTLRVQDDPAALTYLIACLMVDGKDEAWLRDRLTENITKLQKGQSFVIAERQFTVEAIGSDRVTLRANDGRFDLVLGDNFRNLKPLTPVSDASGSATAPASEPR
jgi:hypothetical protein